METRDTFIVDELDKSELAQDAIREFEQRIYEQIDEAAKRGYRLGCDYLHIYYTEPVVAHYFEWAARMNDNPEPEASVDGGIPYQATYSLKEEDLNEKARQILTD